MVEVHAEWLQTIIPLLQAIRAIETITKGFSGDKKYLITAGDQTKYIFRTARLESFERKKEEFEILRALQQYEIHTSRPIDIGVLESAGLCYSLYSYLEGEDASDALPHLTEEEQYQVGVRAGEELRKINQYPAHDSITPWYPRVKDKCKGYIAAYRTCGVMIPKSDQIIQFIEENEHLIKDRPTRLQHDDFHVGNILVANRQYAGTIDFNRFDWGDPVHDFYKLALFSKDVSVPFCHGQVDGYFGSKGIPENFWRLYSVYVAMSMFSALVWSVRVTPELVEEMKERLLRVLEDHQYFTEIVPMWYRSAK